MTLVGGRFELLAVAGEGGMGTVHRALDHDTSKQVAVKVLQRSADAQRFAREARLLEDVQNPAVVRYVAQGTTADERPYLVMEWLEGEELTARLSRGPLTIAESVLLARRVAGALVEIHARGVVHRDLKPSNLYLPGGRVEAVKLLDFSIALPREGQEHLTRTGIAIGTPGYMAPEQARGERDVDGRADLFSLGCVLFQCVTGRPAFMANQVIALLTKVLLEEAPRVSTLRPEVPEILVDLIDRMMCKRPDGRPAGGAQVLAELDRIDANISRSLSDTITISSRLCAGEQRLISVLLVGGGEPVGPAPEPRPFAPTLSVETSAVPVTTQTIAAIAKAHGATLDHLADGSWVMALHGAGVPTDRAARAARCALALRAAVGDLPVVLATGRGLAGERAPVGEVIDRAARLLQDRPRDPGRNEAARRWIRVDELSAGLLGDRFEIASEGGQLLLREEREALTDDARLLLGRVTKCVGRDRELRLLEELFDTCISEPSARAVLVTGEAGVGKSRLRRELLHRFGAREEPVEIWIARGDPLSAGSPFGLLGQVLRRAAGVLDGEPIEDRRAKLRARVAPTLDDEKSHMAEFLGELSGTPFPDEESVQLRAARHDPLVMGDRMLRAFSEFIDAECQRRPVLLILEDLHWGDLPTVQYLDAALRVARDRPFFVLALARPEVETQFPGLWSKRALETIKLGGLARKACAELAREVLGEGAEAAVLERLWAHSQGNAFFLEELLRAQADGRGGDAPPTVLAMVQARLEGLDAEARWVLRAASVFGERFWVSGVAALLGGSSSDRALGALVDDEVIVRSREAKFPGQIEYAFRHALVREAAYAMFTDEARALGHRLAGAWLEDAGEARASVLAEHFERGGARDKAAIWYRRAAEQALEGNDLVLAIVQVERGVACAAAAEGLGEWWLGEMHLLAARASYWRGHHQEALDRGLLAMRQLRRGSGPWCESIIVVADASSRVQDVGQLEVCYAELLAIDPAEVDASGGSRHARDIAALYAIALAKAARHGFFAGHQRPAEQLLRRSEEVALHVGDDPAVAAEVAWLQVDLGRRLALMESARTGFEQAGDLRNACILAVNASDSTLQLGAYDRAEQLLRSTLVEVERLGLVGLRATAKTNLGLALAVQGKLAEGIRIEEEAIALAREDGNRRFESAARDYLSRIALLAGDPARAATEAQVILDEPTTLASDRAYALAILSVAKVALGQPEEAPAAAREAMELLATLGETEEAEAFIRLAYAEALQATGEGEAARAAIAEAHARLLARAGKIADLRLRESFLTRVPENARTLDLASRALAP